MKQTKCDDIIKCKWKTVPYTLVRSGYGWTFNIMDKEGIVLQCGPVVCDKEQANNLAKAAIKHSIRKAGRYNHRIHLAY